MAQELKVALPVPPITTVDTTSTNEVKEPIELHDYLAPSPLFGAPDPKDGWTVVLDKKVDPLSPKDVEGAELMSIWRRPAPGVDPKLGLVQYRSVGTCPIPAQQYFDVQWDIDYHKVWDEYCIKLVKHAVQGSSDLIYWKVKFPWPMDDRDYVLNRRAVVDRLTPQGPYWYALSQTTKNAELAAIKGTVRVDTYSSHFVIRPLPLSDGTSSTRACQFAVLAIDDPKMVIPQAVINWAVEKALPGMMKKFRQAATKYDAWKATTAAKKGAITVPSATAKTATTTTTSTTSTTTTTVATTNGNDCTTTTTTMERRSSVEVESNGVTVMTADSATVTQVRSCDDDTTVVVASESVSVALVEPNEGK